VNILEFITVLSTFGLEVEHKKHESLERAAKFVEGKAKAVLGTYEYGWPQLSESTQEGREYRGYPANEPGLVTGAMRDSIEHTVSGDTAWVGSNDKHLEYFELGTSRQPPRSVLAETVIRHEKEIGHMIGHFIFGNGVEEL
jgi:hypothetical protein